MGIAGVGEATIRQAQHTQDDEYDPRDTGRIHLFLLLNIGYAHSVSALRSVICSLAYRMGADTKVCFYCSMLPQRRNRK